MQLAEGQLKRQLKVRVRRGLGYLLDPVGSIVRELEVPNLGRGLDGVRISLGTLEQLLHLLRHGPRQCLGLAGGQRSAIARRARVGVAGPLECVLDQAAGHGPIHGRMLAAHAAMA